MRGLEIETIERSDQSGRICGHLDVLEGFPEPLDWLQDGSAGNISQEATMLEGKVILVTGGSSGIGRAAIDVLARRGANPCPIS